MAWPWVFSIPQSLQFCATVTDRHLLICRALNRSESAEDGLANLVRRVRAFLTDLDVPLTLKDLGIAREDFDAKTPQTEGICLRRHGLFSQSQAYNRRTVRAQVLRFSFEGKDIDF